VISDFAKEESKPENSLGSLLIKDVKIVETAQANCAQPVTQRQARKICKIPKNDARIKAGKVFPEYADCRKLGSTLGLTLM
jgi:hypothetical protein